MHLSKVQVKVKKLHIQYIYIRVHIYLHYGSTDFQIWYSFSDNWN